jgi:DHA1 family bicyclomycin/chloramphenicol resistance-like MFS transporter
MSQAMSGLGLLAIASPAAGGWLAAHHGWRSALALVALIVLCVLLFVWRWVPETIRLRNPRATQLRPLAATVLEVLRHPGFLAWALLTSASYGGLFTLLAASSFVYIGVLGISAAQYGLALASAALAYFVGTVFCRRWLLRLGLTGAVRRGAWFSLAGGVGLAAAAAAGVEQVWAVLLPHWLFCFGHGVHQPCGQTGAVGPFAHAAGVASALAGCLLALVAFGVGLWLGQALDGTLRPMAYGLAFWGVASAAVAWTLVQRHGAPATMAVVRTR